MLHQPQQHYSSLQLVFSRDVHMADYFLKILLRQLLFLFTLVCSIRLDFLSIAIPLSVHISNLNQMAYVNLKKNQIVIISYLYLLPAHCLFIPNNVFVFGFYT